LIDIWQNGDATGWEEGIFEIIKEILLERLGHVPSQSIHTQVTEILSNISEYLENDELDKALRECERAIQMMPDLAITYMYLGEVYDEMGQPGNAIINYQTALQLDPEFEDAWLNLVSAEKDLEIEFQKSITKQHLDKALEYTYDNEPERALEECELAKPTMPSIAIAYNYFGLILEELEQIDSASESYLKAVTLNPRFYSARENLANARLRLEEEQYHLVSMENQNEIQERDRTSAAFDESKVSVIPERDVPIPQWLYMDEKAYLLVGWAGHRTRQGRSGYDPLETDFEYAHMQGVIIRLLITRKFRTRNPIYLLLMTCVGLIYCSPLFGVIPFLQGDNSFILVTILYSPYWIVGIMLLINVFLSLQLEKSDEHEENNSTFF
jgi:tetratricopeptide (TPR) repeat protein